VTALLSAEADRSAVESRGHAAAHRFILAIPAILLALLLVLPFLNKAFAVDDPVFLLESTQVMRDFWHPLHFDLCWDNPPVCAAAPLVVPHVTLMAYFLLPATWFGSPEWLVHLMQLAALCLGLAATVSIALRLRCNELEASLSGLMVAAFPPTLAYTNGATPDILAMSLGAAGIDRLLLWRQVRTRSSGVAAAVLLGLAPLARPHLLLLVPIAAIAIASGTKGQRVRPARVLSLVAISATIFLLGVRMAGSDGANVAIIQPRLIAAARIVFNLCSYFWYLVIPFPLGLAWMMASRRGAALLLAAVAIFAALTRLGDVNGQVALIVVCACSAAFVLLATVHKAVRERSWNLMLLIAWTAIPLAAVSYIHLPPKYLLGGAPAIAILIILFLRKSRFATAFLCVLLAGCLTLSWLTLRADTEFAGKARLAAEDLVRPETAAGHAVWFTGEWGIYWYAQRAGARVLMSAGPQPTAGDLLLVGSEGAALNLGERFPHRTLLARKEYVSRFGRTMSHEAGAGLYSNVVGPFIWSPGNGYLGSYELWRID